MQMRDDHRGNIIGTEAERLPARERRPAEINQNCRLPCIQPEAAVAAPARVKRIATADNSKFHRLLPYFGRQAPALGREANAACQRRTWVNPSGKGIRASRLKLIAISPILSATENSGPASHSRSASA